MAIRGISNQHSDRFVLDLLNIVLGEGMSSRLFLEIREQRGLAYDVNSHVNYLHDSGSINIYAGADPKKVKDVIQAALMQLGRLRDETVSEAEITKAKELGKGRLMLRMEDTRSVAGWMTGQELLTGKILTVDEVVAIIDAITAKDIQRMAQELFHTNKISLALVGPYCDEENLHESLKI